MAEKRDDIDNLESDATAESWCSRFSPSSRSTSLCFQSCLYCSLLLFTYALSFCQLPVSLLDHLGSLMFFVSLILIDHLPVALGVALGSP